MSAPVPAPVLGLPEVDSQLAPVLPPGWLGLLLGESGSGMPLFAKQFAQAGLAATPVFYYTTYERTEDIDGAFRAFGWAPEGLRVVNLSEEYYERVLRRDLEVSRIREHGLTYRDLAAGPAAPVRRRRYNLPHRIVSDLAALDGPFRLVVDSLDFFLEVLDAGEVLRMVRQIRHRLQSLGGQALLLLQTDVHERRTTGLLEDLADLVVELRSLPDGAAGDHLFTVRKVRNHPDRTGRRPVRVTDRGLVVGAPGSGDAPRG